ncbi:uncharacterized protein P884DRAFT_269873 [Thermothelomyces heterothallicus CBS 202.75]|uniref:uncharacterized protein n=1 Tax=Thermothelomyces heterothallicus CBS 202.75 TaxID=1149848 RepID=UPI0037425CBE
MTLDALAAPYPLAELPQSGLHPVVLARLMLIFAITLQSISGTKTKGLLQLTEPASVLMRRLVRAVRSALTVAQLMGLHRSSLPPLQRIDRELDADPESMWFEDGPGRAKHRLE